MEERLKNMVFISICEACITNYRIIKNFNSFGSWCGYLKNFICGNISGGNIPKQIIALEFKIIDYLNDIYGFSDDDSFPLIYEFFKDEKWTELYEIANYTLHIQKYQRF